MKRELDILITAFIFFTRIPLKTIGEYKEENLNRCTRYFPIVGWFVGAVSFLVFYLCSFLFSPTISVSFSILVGILITGAFHEDGLGDVFDGFGGGWTKTKILDIMKDSRLGTYGTLALVFMMLLKFYALSELVLYFSGQWVFLFLVFVNYHTTSRVAGIIVSFLIPYSREDESSKSKPLVKSFTWKEVVMVLLFGGIPFVFLIDYSSLFLLIIPVLMSVVVYARYYFMKWIDGYTGDCLGAVEQFSELFFLLSLLALCKFI